MPLTAEERASRQLARINSLLDAQLQALKVALRLDAIIAPGARLSQALQILQWTSQHPDNPDSLDQWLDQTLDPDTQLQGALAHAATTPGRATEVAVALSAMLLVFMIAGLGAGYALFAPKRGAAAVSADDHRRVEQLRQRIPALSTCVDVMFRLETGTHDGACQGCASVDEYHSCKSAIESALLDLQRGGAR